MTIRDLRNTYCGTDEYIISFYCLNNSEHFDVKIGDLFTDKRCAGILDYEVEQWEFFKDGMCIMYHND